MGKWCLIVGKFLVNLFYCHAYVLTVWDTWSHLVQPGKKTSMWWSIIWKLMVQNLWWYLIIQEYGLTFSHKLTSLIVGCQAGALVEDRLSTTMAKSKYWKWYPYIFQPFSLILMKHVKVFIPQTVVAVPDTPINGASWNTISPGLIWYIWLYFWLLYRYIILQLH